MAQHDVTGIGPRAAAGLHNNGGIAGLGGFHDRQTLFHVVDVEGGHAVAAFSRVIKKLS